MFFYDNFFFFFSVDFCWCVLEYCVLICYPCVTWQNTAPAPLPGALGMQAVALRVTSDYAAFHDCTVLGNQDSLYDHNGRHYYTGWFIQGSIDFIFGNGLSMFYVSPS